MKKWFGRWKALHGRAMRAAWLRRDVRDATALVALAGIAYALAHFLDLPRRIFTLALSYDHLEMDDVLFVGFVLSVDVPAYEYLSAKWLVSKTWRRGRTMWG